VREVVDHPHYRFQSLGCPFLDFPGQSDAIPDFLVSGDSLAKPERARKFHDNAVRSLPEERAAEIAARTLALPDAQRVEDLTALLISAGER
jgi:hypothetical protein